MPSNSLKNELETILTSINDDPSFLLLFKNIWEEESILAKIFLSHKNQLFPSITGDEIKFRLKYLFWDNYISSESPEPSVMAVEFETTQLKRNRWEKMDVSTKEFYYDLRDIASYYLIRIIKECPEIRQLILTEDYTFNEVKRVLKDYNCFTQSLQRIKLELSNLDSNEDEVVKSKTKRLAELKWMTGLFDEIVDISRGTATPLMMLPLYGHDIKEDLIDSRDIKPEEYSGAINRAYMIGLFERSQSIFWCENCRDSRQIFFSYSKLDPVHVNLPCLKCGQPMYAAISYHLKPSLLKMIEFEDGFLAIAIAHFLETENINYEYSVKSKFESDFILDVQGKKVLIESKMHRIDVEKRGIRGSLNKDLTQLLRHAKALKKEGIEIESAISVVNYDKDNMDELATNLLKLKKYIKEVKKYKVKMISYIDLPKILHNLTR